MSFPELPAWRLAAIVEVPFEDRIQCQCKTCGHIIYRRIHIIMWADDRIECWGQDCYKRELGATTAGRTSKSVYDFVDGRSLTPEERELLRENREQLIHKFREEQERRVQAEREREQGFRNALEKREHWREISKARPDCFPSGEDVTSELARFQSARISVDSQSAGWPPDHEGTCKYCGKKTRDWQSFSGKTGMCVCRDCYRQGKSEGELGAVL